MRSDQTQKARAAALGDLNMMVSTGGRRRTETKFRSLLEAAGFELQGIIPTARPFADVVDAVRVTAPG